VNISNTQVKYHSIKIKKTKSVTCIIIATIKNIFEVINPIVKTIIIGKLKNIIKFIKTLIFRINNKKYNLNVVSKLSIAIFDDIHIDSKIHLLFITISYLGYTHNKFIIVHTKNNAKYT
jgi:hypothetical protein